MITNAEKITFRITMPSIGALPSTSLLVRLCFPFDGGSIAQAAGDLRSGGE
jgi:hypothetical protein